MAKAVGEVEQRAVARRVHADSYPVYRAIRGYVATTTALELEDPAGAARGRPTTAASTRKAQA